MKRILLVLGMLFIFMLSGCGVDDSGEGRATSGEEALTEETMVSGSTQAELEGAISIYRKANDGALFSAVVNDIITLDSVEDVQQYLADGYNFFGDSFFWDGLTPERYDSLSSYELFSIGIVDDVVSYMGVATIAMLNTETSLLFYFDCDGNTVCGVSAIYFIS